jgi:hypothetical protein
MAEDKGNATYLSNDFIPSSRADFGLVHIDAEDFGDSCFINNAQVSACQWYIVFHALSLRITFLGVIAGVDRVGWGIFFSHRERGGDFLRSREPPPVFLSLTGV